MSGNWRRLILQEQALPGFWPKKEETHRIPFEKCEIKTELERLRRRRLERRDKGLASETAVAVATLPQAEGR